MREFLNKVVVPNIPRYIIIIAVCFLYSFGLTMFGPKLYKSEALLAFKNRDDIKPPSFAQLQDNPLPMFLEEAPVEDQYDYGVLLYSRNLADRVLGDQIKELYDPKKYDGVEDFYFKFLSQLGYEYDGEKKTVKITYTYKDSEKASEFVNGFATNLEAFMTDAMRAGYLTPVLRDQLEKAREEEAAAKSDVDRISKEFNVADVLTTPTGWVKAYGTALDRSYLNEAQMASITGALNQLQRNKKEREKDAEKQGPPDTTIIRDLTLSSLRLRYALLNMREKTLSETITLGSPGAKRLESEKSAIKNYLEKQYDRGFDVEAVTLRMKLQESIVDYYLSKHEADRTYKRLETLPALEAQVRPAIRRANVATATVNFLERMYNYVSIGEDYGANPIEIIDPGTPSYEPIQPGWNTLKYLLPTMLVLSTLWFALTSRMLDESVSTMAVTSEEVS
jgi:uncharacterized protein involved in exopolysaccharide biosynthesis